VTPISVGSFHGTPPYAGEAACKSSSSTWIFLGSRAEGPRFARTAPRRPFDVAEIDGFGFGLRSLAQSVERLPTGRCRARLRSLPVQSKDWLRMLAGCAELNALQRYIETKRRLDTYRNKKRNAADDLPFGRAPPQRLRPKQRKVADLMAV
jgi:hypothetical protein